MTSTSNPGEALAAFGALRVRAAIAACCLCMGAGGCSTASLEEPGDATAYQSVPGNTGDSQPMLTGAKPGAERAAWSQHLRAGRQHLALKEYGAAEEEFMLAMDLAGGYGPATQRQITSLVNLELVAQKYSNPEDLIRISRAIIPIAAPAAPPASYREPRETMSSHRKRRSCRPPGYSR